MTESSRPPGKTTIAPEVLVTIARLTALSVPGVSHLASTPSEVERFFNRSSSEGIKITIENELVYADIYVIVQADFNVAMSVVRSISSFSRNLRNGWHGSRQD